MDEVVLAVQQGTVPFDVIAPQYSELIYCVIHRHMKQVDGCDIGDFYNAGLLGLYNAFKTFDFNVGTKFKTYAYWKIYGEMTKRKRESNCKGWRHQRDSLDHSLYDESPACTWLDVLKDEPFDQGVMLKDTINQFLKSERDRLIVFGIIEQGLTQKEIAQRLGISQQSVGQYRKRLIPLLQAHLEKMGYTA